MEFGERLSAWLAARSMSQKALAERIGMSRAVVSMWISGKVKPSHDALQAIIGALAVDMSTFYGEIPVAA